MSIRGEACKNCDGTGFRTKRDMFNRVLEEKVCSKCNGMKVNSGPSKGNRRFFRQQDDELDLDSGGRSIEQMTRNFLKSRGY